MVTGGGGAGMYEGLALSLGDKSAAYMSPQPPQAPGGGLALSLSTGDEVLGRDQGLGE